MVSEVLLDPLHHGARELGLVIRAVQPFFLFRIGDEGRFHQHGGDVRGLKDGKPRLLHLAVMHDPDLPEIGKHRLGRQFAEFQGPALGHLPEELGQFRGLVHRIDAPDAVRVILLVGEPLGLGTGGPVLGEDKNRGARRVLILLIGIGMDGNEEIGVVLAPQFDALVEAQVVITVPHQVGAHPGLPIDQVRQLASDGQGDVLFRGAIDADGPRVLAPMPRIDSDDEIAPAMAGGLGRCRG